MESFNELKLSPSLMRAITELGYEKPSPIQIETLPILLGAPTDFVGLAATGTGKTAAFAIPLLERIDPKIPAVQALILCPTRELALQVAGQIDLLGKHKGVKALPIYGGASYGDQIFGLKRGAMVVVGTPGRIVDHMERGTLQFDELKTIVLDEADEMISMGFKDDIETILNTLPPGMANTWLFSATMSRDVRKVADEYLREPQQVQVNKKEMLPENIEQLYYMTHEEHKPEILCKLIDAADDFYGLVFCQTKVLVQEVTQYLKDRGYRVDCLHGDMDQTARERTMKVFRDRRVSLLICTDVASRGLDVKDITHVINYSIPRELDNYVHRIGRTARSGKAGYAMSLVTPSHRVLIGRIEKMTKRKIMEGKLPTRKDIGTKKVSKILDNFRGQETFLRAVELMDDAWRDAIATMSQEEIAGRFLTMMFPDVFVERDKDGKKPVVVPAGPLSVIVSSGNERAERRSYSPRPRMESRSSESSGDRRYGRPKRDKAFGERPSWQKVSKKLETEPGAIMIASVVKSKIVTSPLKIVAGGEGGFKPPRAKKSFKKFGNPGFKDFGAKKRGKGLHA